MNNSNGEKHIASTVIIAVLCLAAVVITVFFCINFFGDKNSEIQKDETYTTTAENKTDEKIDETVIKIQLSKAPYRLDSDYYLIFNSNGGYTLRGKDNIAVMAGKYEVKDTSVYLYSESGEALGELSYDEALNQFCGEFDLEAALKPGSSANNIIALSPNTTKPAENQTTSKKPSNTNKPTASKTTAPRKPKATTTAATTVKPSVKLSKSSVSIGVGDSITLTAYTVPGNTAVFWSSSNISVAEVSQKGQITGTASGSAIITARITDGKNNYSATCNVTVYGKTQTVSFNTNGGSDISAITVEKGSSVKLPAPSKAFTVTFNLNGGGSSVKTCQKKCTFVGWYENPGFSGTKYSAGSSYTVNKNVTLFAKWTNPTLGNVESPSRDGYKFSGWYTEKNGGSKYTSGSEITGNITLYAHWEKKTLTVPNVEGMNYMSAKQSLEASGYSVTLVPTSSSSYSEGTVISQNPAAGTEVLQGTNIKLTYSTGVNRVKVPNVVGQNVNSAKNALSNSGLKASVVYESSYNYNQIKDTVTSQSISGGETVAENSTITIYVSKGPKPIQVGDYVWFDGGKIWRQLGGSYVEKEGSSQNGELIITDGAKQYNGKTYYGVKFQGASVRYGWVEESLLHQRTN